MATFAVGDIHGRLDALDDLLAGLGPEARAGDTVVFLGDYIDTGPDGWPRPALDGRTIGLDTISHGVLTAVRLPERRLIQSGRYRP